MGILHPLTTITPHSYGEEKELSQLKGMNFEEGAGTTLEETHSKCILVTGETGDIVICDIALEEDEHYLSVEDVIMRACSALLPEIDFDPRLLFLKDKEGFHIAPQQVVYAGERVTLHSNKGDVVEAHKRCGILFHDGTIQVVPFGVEENRNIQQYILRMHGKHVESSVIDEHLRRVVSEKAGPFEVWCFIEDAIEYSTSVRIAASGPTASDVMRTALAQLKLTPEIYELVGEDHVVCEYEQVKIKRKGI